jgi:hypothetical protein
MAHKNKPQSKKQDVVIQEHDGEVLIYDLRRDKAFCLNSTAALIWRLCDGNRSVGEIGEQIGKDLKVANADDLVWLALDQLNKDKLIENAPDSSGRFAGMSRREVMRKVAVGSAIALPIIAGLVAPPAYAIGSACGGTVCTCTRTSPGTGGAVCVAFVACPGTPPTCTVCHANSPFVGSPTTPTAARAGTCSMT